MSALSRDFFDDLAAAELGVSGAQAATSDRTARDYEWALDILTKPTEEWPADTTPADYDYFTEEV